MLQAKRSFEVGMRKLGVMNSIANNPNVSVYGQSQDNLLSQVAAFRMTEGLFK
jgi:hypothetical protein